MSLSTAIVATIGFRFELLSYRANGSFFITLQHLSETLNGASTRGSHFSESLKLGEYFPSFVYPVLCRLQTARFFSVSFCKSQTIRACFLLGIG